MTVLTNGFLQGRLPEELKKVLRSVASELGDVIDDMDAIQVVPLKGAMTNEVYQINWPLNDERDLVRKVLVRIYGEGVELFFNRDDELRTFECMSRHGQGPRLLGRFSVGRVEEFIHARVCYFLPCLRSSKAPFSWQFLIVDWLCYIHLGREVFFSHKYCWLHDSRLIWTFHFVFSFL